MRLSSLLPFVVSAVLIPQTYAWGAVGHEVVATIAQMHLHPSVMPKLCDILHFTEEACHLAPVAAWADRVRVQPKYRWTGPLHYVNAIDDYPSATCAFPGPQGWAGRTHINVLNGIRNTTNVLQEFEAYRRAGVPLDFKDEDEDDDTPNYVQDALKFLIHFIGDMHQPLHLAGRDRGGNEIKVAFDGRTTNLHSVWDGLLISERLRTLPRNYTRPLPFPDVESHLRGTIYDPYIRRLVWEGLLGKWKDELEGWVACPAPFARQEGQGQTQGQHQHQSPPASTWQTVLALFSSSRKGDEHEHARDGGLGVDDADLCPYAWASVIHELNCDIVFPKELDLAPLDGLASSSNDDEGCARGHASEDEDVYDAQAARKSHYLELYTPGYTGVIKERWIVEKLLTQAGIRLAAVLNWIFAEPTGDELNEGYITL